MSLFGKKKAAPPPEEEDQLEQVLFQGATNGKEANLAANAKLVQAGLVRTKEMLSDALSRRAEMIRMEPKGNASVSTFYVDGVPYPADRHPVQVGLAITQMVKLLAGLDIQVRNKPQAGGIRVEHSGTPYVMRVNVFPVQGGGERLIVRAENKKVKLVTAEDLGFPPELRDMIREKAATKKGVMLAAGPPMSGLSTLAFATVRAIDAYLYTVYSIADTEGRDLGNISKFVGNPGDNLAQTIGRAERAEGNVLFVDPLREDTAKTIFESSEDICIIGEINAADAAEGIVKARDFAGAPKLVAQQLHGVISQKLIRLLCRKCRQAFKPNPKLLAKIGLPPETNVLYKAPDPPAENDAEYEPCAKCGGVGYFGRAGMFEFIEVTEPVRQVIVEGGDAAAIKQAARADKRLSLQAAGLRLVAEGKTSLEELQRVFRTK